MCEWPGYDKRVATEWELVREKSMVRNRTFQGVVRE